MLRWTAVILRFTMIVTCSAWNLNDVMDRLPRGQTEDGLNYQAIVSFKTKGLFTRSCEELRNIEVSTGYIPTPTNDEKNICQVDYESVVCRRRPPFLHDKKWLEKTLKEYQMHATQHYIRNTVQCLLSKLRKLKNKRSVTEPLQQSHRLKANVQSSRRPPKTTVVRTSQKPLSTKIHKTSPIKTRAPTTVPSKPTTKLNRARPSVRPTTNVITTAMKTTLVGDSTAVKTTLHRTPAEISTDTSQTGIAVTGPRQSTTEAVFGIIATDAHNSAYHENTRNKKTTMFVSILAVLGIIHIALIVLLIVSCQCYVTRRRSNKKTAAGKYTPMNSNPQTAKTQESSNANSNTLDLWTQKKPSPAT